MSWTKNPGYSESKCTPLQVNSSANELWGLTCAFRAVDVRAGLIAEKEPAVLRATIYTGNGRFAFAVAPIVREGEGAAERTRLWRCILSEHRIK